MAASTADTVGPGGSEPATGAGRAAFGKYTLIAKIGHGGMAEVFLAALNGPAGFTKLTVLKRLHPHLEDDPGFIAMFLDEARLAARLNHPHVVSTHEVGEADGRHFLAMEYLEGQSLSKVLKHVVHRREVIPPAIGARVIADALSGLQYAHSLCDFDGNPLDVVHRDISPGNLFITFEGAVKVLDFGIARASTRLVQTHAGQVKGKFAYMAPEQARGHAVDPRSDVWSMGVVMYEIFTGRYLFRGESEMGTIQNTLALDVPPLHTVADVPPELGRIASMALERDPARRYQSADAMRADLERFLHTSESRTTRAEVGSFVARLFARQRDEQRRLLGAFMRGESSMPPGPRDSADPSSIRSPSGLGRPGTPVSPTYPSVNEPGAATPSHPLTPGAPPPSSRPSHGGPSSARPAEERSRVHSKAEAPEKRRSRLAFLLMLLLAAVVGALIATVVPPVALAPQEQPDREVPLVVEPMSTMAATPEVADETGSRAPSPSVRAPAPLLPPEPFVPMGPPAPESSGSSTPDESGSDPPPSQPPAPRARPDQDAPSAATDPTAPRRRAGRTDVSPTRIRTRARPTPSGRPSLEPSSRSPQSPSPGPEAAVVQHGFLTLDTVPWSEVSLGGRSLGTTPMIRARLPAGTHVLTLANPERGLRTTYRITIRAGETTTRRVGLQ